MERVAGELPEGTLLLDRYEVIDRIASGGMATIYRAMDDRLDRVVCVKLLRLVVKGTGSGGGAGSVYRATYSHFMQEALALSKLQHPNTLRIYDFGYLAPASPDESGAPFQISEYLDGGNLASHIRRRGALTADETCAIFDCISGAVAEGHEHGIVHRDIKPSNILFARVGDVLMPKLADFGIAQSALKKQRRPGEFAPPEEEKDLVTTVALFSPRWAAPEQLSGATQGTHTDVYALGLLALFMLTGKALFDDKDVKGTFQARVLSDDLVDTRLNERPLPDAVRRLLRAALRADPDSRLGSPGALSEQLRVALGVGPVALPPAVVPRPVAHSLTLETNVFDDGYAEARLPKEQSLTIGTFNVRLVEVNEALEFTQDRVSSRGGPAAEVRFRVTLLPGQNTPMRINVKGLNCFVAVPGGRPTPALVVGETGGDGALDLIDSSRARIGGLSWSFGTDAHDGRVFLVDGEELVVPYKQASHAVMVRLGQDRELIVMCRRT